MLFHLFAVTARPYLVMLHDWLHHGKLQDAAGEFFVCQGGLGGGGGGSGRWEVGRGGVGWVGRIVGCWCSAYACVAAVGFGWRPRLAVIESDVLSFATRRTLR